MKDFKNTLAFIWQFSRDDFKNKYAGSLLGAIWAFVQPLMTVIIYWFIFQVGFRSQPVEGFPFILWLVSGLTSWFFFSEAIVNATSSMVEYSYLVKKVLFNINILPLVKICSVLFVQLFLLAFNLTLFAFYGYYPDIYLFQIIYYLIYMIILTLGISYLTAALYVFFKDLIQIVSILMQIVFWTTPFVWDLAIMPDSAQAIIRHMPMYYVVSGYRDTFINKIWFWERPEDGIYYWLVALLLLYIGVSVFHRLKIHFADVL